MRYSILDDLVDPLWGSCLCVENPEVIPRQNLEAWRYQRWCGRSGRLAAQVDPRHCHACQDVWIVAGELVRTGDASMRYPIDHFATQIEKRYSRRLFRDWLGEYGFDASFSGNKPYWIALAQRSCVMDRSSE